MSSLCSRPVRSLLLARAPAYRFIAAACSLALLPLAPRRVIRRALTARACSQLHGTLHCSQWRQANFCVVYSRGIVRAKLPLWDQHVIRGGPHTGLAPPAIAQLNKGQRCSLADSTYPHTHFLQAPLDTSHPPLSLPTSPSRRRRGQLFFPLWSFPHPQLQALPTSKPFCHPHSLQPHQPLVHLAWWFATQGSPCPQSSCRLSVPFPLWSCTGFCLPLWFPRVSTWKTAPMATAIAVAPPKQSAVERQLQMSQPGCSALTGMWRQCARYTPGCCLRCWRILT